MIDLAVAVIVLSSESIKLGVKHVSRCSIKIMTLSHYLIIVIDNFDEKMQLLKFFSIYLISYRMSNW